MLLRVNPNRMELLRLRKRLVLAVRGHKLLEDKLEEMMRRFLSLLKDIEQAKSEFKEYQQRILDNMLYCRLTTSRDNLEASLTQIKSHPAFTVSELRIMNVKVPLFAIQKLSLEKDYDFFTTSAQLDLVVAQAKEYIQALLRLGQLVKALEVLSYEIERTRRRVNALEHMLIPSIQETIRHITQKLNELERGNLVRLMRVKEIVRSH